MNRRTLYGARSSSSACFQGFVVVAKFTPPSKKSPCLPKSLFQKFARMKILRRGEGFTGVRARGRAVPPLDVVPAVPPFDVVPAVPPFDVVPAVPPFDVVPP